MEIQVENVQLKHFNQTSKFDPNYVREEINNSTFWNWINLRRLAYQSQHKHVEDIVLRFQPVQGMFTFEDFLNGKECADLFVQKYLPKTTELVIALTSRFKVGRVVIAKLKAGGSIGTHVDEGEYHKDYSRYHLVVDTNPQVTFTCEDETIHMPEGTIWWFNNRVPHSVKNEGDTDRTHIIVDIKKQ